MVDVHNYSRRLEGAIGRVNRAPISETNRKALFSFHSYCLADGVSPGKLYRYLDDILLLNRWINKDFKRFTRRDMEQVMIRLDQTSYSEWTKYSFKTSLRRFFRWLGGKDELPEHVRWIKLRMKNCNHKLPEELITEEEVKKMILAAGRPRDRALISSLYESGCRISEILTIRMKNVNFDRYGSVITVSGKTGSRRVRLVFSVNYLQDWINKHPFHDNPEAFVWNKGMSEEILTYGRARDLLADLGKKAGIKKRVNPHNFRHSRASFLANHLTESQLKEVFGWTQASRMASVYVHLSGKNTDSAILKVYGKKFETESDKDELMPKNCPRCKTENETTHKYCKLCGMVLDEKARTELIATESQTSNLGKLMTSLLQDPEIKELIAQKIRMIDR